MPQGPVKFYAVEVGYVKLLPRTLAEAQAGLPDPAENVVVLISDSNTTTPGDTITGSGNDVVLGRYTGSAWVVL